MTWTARLASCLNSLPHFEQVRMPAGQSRCLRVPMVFVRSEVFEVDPTEAAESVDFPHHVFRARKVIVHDEVPERYGHEAILPLAFRDFGFGCHSFPYGAFAASRHAST